jgi:hypothetical protein
VKQLSSEARPPLDVCECEASHALAAICRALDEASRLAREYLDRHARKCGPKQPGCRCPMCVKHPEMYRLVDAAEMIASAQGELLENLRPLTAAEYEEISGHAHE